MPIAECPPVFLMPSLPLLEHLAPFLLVLFRLSGLFIFAPILASTTIPAKFRALICFMFAVAIYPTIPSDQMRPIELDLFTLGPAIFAETLIGLAIGLLAALPLFAVQLGGMIMSQQAGMSLGTVYNPALETDTDILGQFLQYSAMVIFISMGGLEILFLACTKTFASVPVGQALSLGAAGLSPIDLFTGLVASGFNLALRVASPVLCIIFIETVVSALVMKTMPQLNIMSIGFAVKIVATTLALIAGYAAIGEVLSDDLNDTLGQVLRWAESLK